MHTIDESAYEPGVERLRGGLNDGEEPIRSDSRGSELLIAMNVCLRKRKKLE